MWRSGRGERSSCDRKFSVVREREREREREIIRKRGGRNLPLSLTRACMRGEEKERSREIEVAREGERGYSREGREGERGREKFSF